MTVQELIDELNKLDRNALVIHQGDAEGNHYRLLSGVDGDDLYYLPDTPVAGDVVQGDRSGTPCVVVYPK